MRLGLYVGSLFAIGSITLGFGADFSVSVSPSARTVTQGGSVTYAVTVQSLSGFNSSVSLSVLNLPGNQVLPGTGFSPQTVTPPANGTTQSTLTIVTNTQTPTRTVSLTVQGVSGNLTRTFGISIPVNAPDFTISVTPSSNTVTQGSNATYSVTVNSQNGFNSGVLLEILNLPSGYVVAGTGFSPGPTESGRSSCRAGASISMVAGSLKKKAQSEL